jgi:hypothetical protein
MSLTFTYKLTNSQRMALIDALTGHWVNCEGDITETFVDCSTNPPTETTLGDLIRLFTDMSAMEISEDGTKSSVL